jgi:AcrR family transcriptional regulator
VSPDAGTGAVASPEAGAAPAAPPAPGRQGQRERILDAALDLMAQRGASATSMRALASACGLNVAALYHYFPSKDALLRAVIDERRYGAQLQSLPLPDLRLGPADRLEALVVSMWEGALSEALIWRLLLSESLHGDATAQDVGRELYRAIEAALTDALARLVPEIAVDPEVAARTVTRALMALLVRASLDESSVVADDARRTAHDLAVLLL